MREHAAADAAERPYRFPPYRSPFFVGKPQMKPHGTSGVADAPISVPLRTQMQGKTRCGQLGLEGMRRAEVGAVRGRIREKGGVAYISPRAAVLCHRHGLDGVAVARRPILALR